MPRRASLARLCAFTFASLLALELGTRGDDWTQWGLGSARTNASSELSGSLFDAASWSLPAYGSSRIVSSPAVADGVVVFGTSGGQVQAARAVDGTSLWSFSAQDGVLASPAILKGRVYAPSIDGKLYCLRLSDGALAWQAALGGAGYSSPTIVSDTRLLVAVGFPQKKVMMIDAVTGSTVWETAPGAISGIVNSSAAVSGTLAIIGSMGGRFYALDLPTGTVKWTFDAPGLVNMSSPLVAGSTAYLLPGGDSAKLYAIDAGTGAAKAGWPLDIADPVSPPSGTIVRTNHAVSSPALAGAWIVFQMQFAYYIEVDASLGIYKYTLREYAVGVKPSVPSVGWMAAVGSKDLTNPNDIPELNLCATTAAFQTASGTLVAVSSSLASVLRVFDPSNGGAVLWSGNLSGPGRSSPVLANGRLFAGTDAGVLESYLSSVNRPPLPPASGFSPANGEVVTTLRPTLSWAAGSDPEGKPVSYVVRIGTGGEILQNWIAEYATAPNVTQAALTANLQEGVLYTYAVRSRDPNGAWSEWSAPQTFAVNLNAAPTITVDGTSASTIADALAAVQPGGTIRLGKGTLRLVVPLQIPTGVSLLGVSAWETLIDARGLGSGIVLVAGPGPGTTKVDGLAVFGAAKNIEVQDQGAVISHVVLQGAAQAGLEVEPGGSVLLLNATVAGNAVGARSLGALDVRNGIVTQNSIGLSASGGGSLKTSYNDLFANAVPYDGATAGTGDLAQSVAFSNTGAMDYRLLKAQATTDAGDPSDNASQEPAPNGGRVNLGAFGGTPLAETSAMAAPVAASSSSGHACAASASSPSSGGLPLILLAAAAMALFLSRGPRRLRLGSRLPVAILLALFLLPAEGRPTRRAVSYVWNAPLVLDGSGKPVPTLFSITTNWTPNGLPGSADSITFNSTGVGYCNLDVPATVAQMTIDSGYSGKISNQSGSFTVTGVFIQRDGTFDAVSFGNDLTIQGNFTFEGGYLDLEGNLHFQGATWDVNGGTIVSGAGTLIFDGGSPQTFKPFAEAVKKDQVWVEDTVPTGANQASDGGDAWTWVSASPAPHDGALANQSDINTAAEHQHYFYNATTTLSVATGDTLFCYVFLDLANPPTEVMLQWNDGSWEHRAYYGANSIFWGSDGTVSRKSEGGLPATNAWVKLSVPAIDVGLEGRTLNGMAFTLYGGKATWDKAGVTHLGIDTVWVEDAVPAGAGLGSDGGDAWTFIQSPTLPLPFSGTKAHQSDNQISPAAEHQHYFYDATNQLIIRTGDTLFAWVFLDGAHMPKELMLQWNDGSWEHRAYWGQDLIGWGTNASPSRFQVSSTLPAANTWTKLVVNASDVGLEGSTLNGMAFTLAGGRATWDHAGRNGYGGAASYGNVTVASGATVDLPAGENLSMSGNMVVNGTFTSSGTNISVQHALTINGSGTFTANSTPVQIGSGLLSDGVSLNSGTLNASSGLMTINGHFTSDQTLATFNPNSGRVMLLNNGSQSFQAPTTAFNDLVINDTLEGYWKLDTATVNTVFDSSGYGRDGTGMSGTTPTPPTILSGGGNVPTVNFTDPGSLSLSSSKWINMPNPPPLAGVGAMTLAGWIKPTAVAGTQRVMGFGSPAPANGLLGEYYDNTGTTSAPPPPKGSPAGGSTTNNPKLVRFDRNVSFGFSSPPGPGIPNDHFMVAWTGKINITTAGTYTFRVNIDDGARVWLDGVVTPIINSWVDQGPTNHDSTPAVVAAGLHDVRIEFYENGGGQQCIFSYLGPDTTPTGTTGSPVWMVVPNSALTPSSPGNSRARIGISGSSIVVDGSSDGVETRPATGGTVTAGTWVHIAGVLDFANKTITIYKDGVQVAPPTAAPFNLAATSSNACTLGALGTESNGLTNYFTGLIDEVRVYSRALSSQEISALALGNQPMTSVPQASSERFISGGSTLSVDGDLTLNSSTLDQGSNLINLKGSWLNHGAALVGNFGTVNLVGDTAGKSLLSGGQHFYWLNVNSGGGTGSWSLADRLTIDNQLVLLSGALDPSTFTNLRAGSINMIGGTFTTVPSTVVLMGTDVDITNSTNTLTTSLTNLRIENPMEGNLLGYWKFDEGQGPKARDSSKARYDGARREATLNGGATWTTDRPALGFDSSYALTLDGAAGSYANAGAPASMPAATGSQSISLWFKYPGTAGTQDFFTLAITGSKETAIGLFGAAQVGVRSIDLIAPSTTTLASVGAPAITAWHHLVYTRNVTTNTNTLYIDGALAATVLATPVSFTPTSLYFGSSSTLSDRFTGFIDDVRVYSRILTSVEVSSLNAGKYAGAGTSMIASYLDGFNPLTVSGTFNVDFGIFDGFGSATTVTGAANVNGGTYQVDSGTSTFTSGLTVGTSGVLETSSSAGIVAIPNTQTLDIKGTLHALSSGSAGATIDRVGGSGSYTFTVEGTAFLDIDGLRVQHAGTNGMDIGDGATFTKFKRLAFTNNTGTRHLRITRNSAMALMAPGLSFDASVSKNVTFLGNSGARPTLFLEARDLATNGAGASSVAIAEGRTEDGDTVRDGVPDSPGVNDTVVFWVKTAATDMTGTIQGSPTPAFNWNTFAWYATYVVYSGTLQDTVFVRNANGDPLYSYPIDRTTYGTVVGIPAWENNGVTKVLYVATSGGSTPRGRILKLTDDGSTSLSLTDTFVDANVSQITSPLIMDSVNIYFGGLNPGLSPKVFGVQRAFPMTLVRTIAAASTVRTWPSWSVNGNTFLYLGSDFLTTNAHLYRMDMTVGVEDQDHSPSPLFSVTAPTTLINDKLHAGDQGGFMHKVDASSAGFTSTVGSWPYHDVVNHPASDAGSAISAMAYVEPTTNQVYYGDTDGHFYVLNSGGTVLSGSWPIKPTTDSFQNGALWLPSMGTVAAGTNNGHLYIINQASHSVTFTYNFGAGVVLSQIAYSSPQNAYLVGTSTGQLFYITPR